MTDRCTLYHSPLCPFSRQVRVLLFEKAIPHSLIIEKPWERRPEFLRLNPMGDVPVLVEADGHVVMHHNAICEYVNETTPVPPMLGETPRGRAEIRRLTGLFNTSFYADVVKPLVGERALKVVQGSSQPPSSALIRAGRENLKGYLSYIGWTAARRPYLGGRAASMADIAAAAHLSLLDYLGEISWEEHPDAKLWYIKIKSRPSFNSLLQDRLVGIIPATTYADLDF